MPASSAPLKAGFLITPGFTVMDVMGAHAVFGMAPNNEVHMLWKNRDVIIGSPLFPTMATTTFDECPDDLDVLVVGAVIPEVISDPDVIRFFKEKAPKARYIIGICGGVLLLGAAGLIKNRTVTTNFHLLDAVAELGAKVVAGGHVVIDGNLYTAGPATGSFEAALMVLVHLRGEEEARLMELTIEYHPTPPFHVGTPELAGTELTSQAIIRYKDFFERSSIAATAQYTALTEKH